MDKKDVQIRSCEKKVRAINDAMYVLGGKWTIHIMTSLYYGKKRYSDILEDIDGISGKMLSRSLKEMEINMLISRVVKDTRPITVQYELTEYGKKLIPVIDKLAEWGMEHRKKLAGRDE